MTSSLEFSLYPAAEVLSFHETRTIWQEAERLGFAAVWHEDNVFPHPTELLPRTTPILDCWTALAALAASTSRIRLGSMVSPAPRRHPALLAKAASTLDTISGGRLTIGIGAGDPTTVQHYEQWGLPFPATPKERVALLREHLEVQRLLYTEETADFDGAHFQLRGAVNNPKPVQEPHPPIWLGLNTNSTVMPGIAARSADGVVVEWGDDAVAAKVVPRLAEACEVIDRDVADMTKARFLCAVVTDGNVTREEAFRILARRSKVYEQDLLQEAWDVWLGSIVGTPAQIAEQLARRTTDLGFDHVMLFTFSLDVDEPGEDVGAMAASFLTGMRVLAREVIPSFVRTSMFLGRPGGRNREVSAVVQMRFSTVIVPTRDVARMRTFYEDVFGFTINNRTGDAEYRPGINWAELQAAQVDPGEPDLELLDPDAHRLPATAGAPGRCLLAFRVDDIEAAVELLDDKGVERSPEVYEEGWGWFVFLKDPDGNDLELFQYREGSWARPDEGS